MGYREVISQDIEVRNLSTYSLGYVRKYIRGNRVMFDCPIRTKKSKDFSLLIGQSNAILCE